VALIRHSLGAALLASSQVRHSRLLWQAQMGRHAPC
jgi:hypothetical protein